MSVISEMREQRRADRAVEAEQRRADRAAERAEQRRDEDAARQRQAERKQVRRQWRQDTQQWVRQHPVELLMSLIVLVPALLAWQAMAVFGIEVYGPVGWILPLFSEAAMWAFAFALHVARRDGRPTGWLQVGLWTFTAVAGALN